MDHAERKDLAHLVREADYVASVQDLILEIESIDDSALAVRLLKKAAARLGADAAVFTSYVRDDVTMASYRYLLACDPTWGVQYAANAWCLDDPWLHYALYNSCPIRSEELPELSSRERWVTEGAALFGFRSTVIVPVPSHAAQSRVSVLCLGSRQQGYFHSDGYPTFRILARSLAMELGDWMFEYARVELMTEARITDEDLTLLRHQQQGHSSKIIAGALHTEAKTIDCRFQRLSLKLGAANRKGALRVAEIYGLI